MGRLLSIMCIDSLPTIVEQLVLIKVDDASELDVVISSIWQTMISDPCNGKAYADMCLALRAHYSEFQPEEEHERPITFARMLLNTAQIEFESSISMSPETTME